MNNRDLKVSRKGDLVIIKANTVQLQIKVSDWATLNAAVQEVIGSGQKA